MLEQSLAGKVNTAEMQGGFDKLRAQLDQQQEFINMHSDGIENLQKKFTTLSKKVRELYGILKAQ